MPDEKQQDVANGVSDEATVEVTDEMLDRYYDFFKHLTTLAVALAVVFLILTRSTPEGTFGYISLGMFALSLIAALSGMEKAASGLLHSEKPRTHLDVRLVLASGWLVGGVTAFAVWLILPH